MLRRGILVGGSLPKCAKFPQGNPMLIKFLFENCAMHDVQGSHSLAAFALQVQKYYL